MEYSKEDKQYEDMQSQILIEKIRNDGTQKYEY